MWAPKLFSVLLTSTQMYNTPPYLAYFRDMNSVYRYNVMFCKVFSVETIQLILLKSKEPAAGADFFGSAFESKIWT